MKAMKRGHLQSFVGLLGKYEIQDSYGKHRGRNPALCRQSNPLDVERNCTRRRNSQDPETSGNWMSQTLMLSSNKIELAIFTIFLGSVLTLGK